MMVSMPQYRVTYASPTIKLMASSDGMVCNTVALNRRKIFDAGKPANNAVTSPATKTTVPGMPTKFRLTVASSGAGFGAIGGIFKTALFNYGIGVLSTSNFKYFAIDW